MSCQTATNCFYFTGVQSGRWWYEVRGGVLNVGAARGVWRSAVFSATVKQQLSKRGSYFEEVSSVGRRVSILTMTAAALQSRGWDRRGGWWVSLQKFTVSMKSCRCDKLLVSTQDGLFSSAGTQENYALGFTPGCFIFVSYKSQTHRWGIRISTTVSWKMILSIKPYQSLSKISWTLSIPLSSVQFDL